jgi:hypothetical protein
MPRSLKQWQDYPLELFSTTKPNGLYEPNSCFQTKFCNEYGDCHFKKWFWGEDTILSIYHDDSRGTLYTVQDKLIHYNIELTNLYQIRPRN